MPKQERQKGKEGGTPEEGFEIVFARPELLRAYVLDHSRIPPKNYAEQISGIRVAPLGEFPLDGQLFESMSISALIERPYRSLKDHPSVIFRTDICLGPDDGEIRKKQREGKGEPEEDELIRRIGAAFNNSSFPQRHREISPSYTIH